MKQESERLCMIWSISFSDKIIIEKIPLDSKIFQRILKKSLYLDYELFITVKTSFKITF